MNFNDFVKLSDEYFDVILTATQQAQFQLFLDEFVKVNAHTNLSAIREPEEILQRTFFGCSELCTDFETFYAIFFDRCGALVGVCPEFPLKILFPELKLCLADSVQRKTAFLSDVINKMGWDDVEVLTERAELIGRMNEHRERYDAVIARALAAMPVLVEYLLPLVKIGGRMIAQKGTSAVAETEAAMNGVGLLGGRLDGIEEVQLPGIEESHYFVIVEKISVTDEKYPRRVGIPTKRPL